MNKTIGKVAFVAGGTGYVGGAIVEALRGAGWTVVIGSRKAGSGALVCDLGDRESVRKAIDATVERHGRLDLCVHSASPAIQRVPLLSMNSQQGQEHIRVAVDGTLNLAQETIPRLSPGGALVVITSGIVFEPAKKDRKRGTYEIAKKAQHELVREIAKEVPTSVRAFAVAPGFLPGGLNRDLPSAARESFAKKSDGTASSAADIGDIVLSIASGDPRYAASASVDASAGTLSPL